jgi:hypothetical protein
MYRCCRTRPKVSMLCTSSRRVPSAYVSIRQHTSAYVSIFRHTSACCAPHRSACPQHTSAYVGIRQHTSAYVSMLCTSSRRVPSAYVSIRRHTSAYVSIRRHTSACCAPHRGACPQQTNTRRCTALRHPQGSKTCMCLVADAHQYLYKQVNVCVPGGRHTSIYIYIYMNIYEYI